MQFSIHIGSYKTGSTAIQVFLKKNREALVEQAFCYPHAACRNDNAHHLLPFALQKPFIAGEHCEASKLVQDILDEGTKNDAQHIVLSSEVFFSLSELQVHRFAALLVEHDVNVIAYLRRQDEFLHSFYMQCIKQPEIQLADSAENYRGFSQAIEIAKYNEILSWWADAFGSDKLVLDTFEKKRLPDGVVPDFVHKMNMDIGSFKHISTVSNETIKTELIEYLRVINALKLDSKLHDKLLSELNKLSREKGELFTNHKFISPEKKVEILAFYEESNEALRAQYFKSRTELFEPYVLDIEEQSNWEKPTLSLDTICRLTGWLWAVGVDDNSAVIRKAVAA